MKWTVKNHFWDERMGAILCGTGLGLAVTYAGRLARSVSAEPVTCPDCEVHLGPAATCCADPDPGSDRVECVNCGSQVQYCRSCNADLCCNRAESDSRIDLGAPDSAPVDSGATSTPEGPQIFDTVNGPAHYRWLPVEAIEVTEHFNFCMGNALKYILRADHKGRSVEDLKKAVWYLQRELKNRETRRDTT